MKNLKELSARLKIAKKSIDNSSEIKRNSNVSYLGSAFKISTELVAAVVVASIIGFILDQWFDTKPWFIIFFFFVGVAAAILNVIRSAKLMQKTNSNEK